MFTVNNKAGLRSLFALTLLMLVSCSSVGTRQSPDWIMNPSDGYPDSAYMTAVGYASNRQTAENNAVAALTKIIRQTVQAETVATESISEREAAWEKSRSIDTYVKTTTDITVTGITIQDVFVTSENVPVYYALAVLDREEAGQIYKRRALETEAAINAKIAAVKKEKGTVSAYKVMSEAAALALENDETLDMLAVINKEMRKSVTPAYKSAASVEELARQFLDATRVFVDVRGDETGRIASAFSLRIQEAGLKTLDESGSDTAALTLSVDVSLDPLDMESTNKYVRYVLTGALIENATGKELEKYGTNGREAHVTESEARARALRTLEQYINNLDILSDLQ